MADTELQQLIIYVGTTAQIEAAIQAGTITENDLSISTDAPDFQEKLTDVQMNAVNSGITTQLVSLYSGHVADTTIHVTAQDKTTWNGKQNALNSTQLNAVNSGITSAGVLQITTNKNNIESEVSDRQDADNNLQSQINDLKARGRFLALWNCATGLAQSNPPQSPYTYKAGDYFIVGTVATGSGTNYRPSGSSYTTGVPSTVVETEAVEVNDVYYYDGTSWSLQINTQKEVSFGSIAGSPYDNTNLSNALNSKQDTLTAGTGVDITNNTIAVDFNDVATAAQGAKADTAVQPAALNDYVTKATTQTITGQKTFSRTETQFQDSIARFVSTLNSSSQGWRGRIIIGAKDYTFLIGTYNGMAALCGHKFTDSATEEGAAWSDIYFSPDGDKAIYFGGNSWRQNSGWFKIQNSGSNTGGTVQVNIGSTSSTNWKNVAYKGENVSDFNNDAGYTTNVGTVTSVNEVTPVDGDVSLPIPTVTFYWGE